MTTRILSPPSWLEDLRLLLLLDLLESLFLGGTSPILRPSWILYFSFLVLFLSPIPFFSMVPFSFAPGYQLNQNFLILGSLSSSNPTVPFPGAAAQPQPAYGHGGDDALSNGSTK